MTEDELARLQSILDEERAVLSCAILEVLVDGVPGMMCSSSPSKIQRGVPEDQMSTQPMPGQGCTRQEYLERVLERLSLRMRYTVRFRRIFWNSPQGGDIESLVSRAQAEDADPALAWAMRDFL